MSFRRHYGSSSSSYVSSLLSGSSSSNAYGSRGLGYSSSYASSPQSYSSYSPSSPYSSPYSTGSFSYTPFAGGFSSTRARSSSLNRSASLPKDSRRDRSVSRYASSSSTTTYSRGSSPSRSSYSRGSSPKRSGYSKKAKDYARSSSSTSFKGDHEVGKGSSSKHHSKSRSKSISSASSGYSSRASSVGEKESNNKSSRSVSRSSSVGPDNGQIDYKKLYEEQVVENDRLMERLRYYEKELRSKQDALDNNNKNSARNALAESERREKRSLERKLSEMEEELKQLQKLKAENEKLRAENRALTRVISKLTNSATAGMGALAALSK